jgi:hypothetical protein
MISENYLPQSHNLEIRLSELEKRVSELEKLLSKSETSNIFYDEVSKLYWEIKEENLENRYTFSEAEEYLKFANSSKYGGFSDWRIPTKSELETLFQKEDILKNLPKKMKPIYWSCSLEEDSPKVWVAYFHHLFGDFKYKTHSYFLRLVRKSVLQ